MATLLTVVPPALTYLFMYMMDVLHRTQEYALLSREYSAVPWKETGHRAGDVMGIIRNYIHIYNYIY